MRSGCGVASSVGSAAASDGGGREGDGQGQWRGHCASRPPEVVTGGGGANAMDGDGVKGHVDWGRRRVTVMEKKVAAGT